jgi:PST family polysaccharide transporter
MKRGLVWATVAVVLSRGLGFVSLLVLTHLLAPSQFGTVAAITTFLALIQLSSDLGMQAAVVYEQEEGVTERVHSAFTLNLVLAAGVTVAGVLLAPLVASFFRVPEATDLFRLACLNVLLYGLGNIHDGLLLRSMSFQQRVRPQLAQGLAQATVSIVLAAVGLGASAMVIGSLAGTACWVVTLWRMAPVRLRIVYRPEIMRSMIGYGGAAAGLEIVAVVASRADALVVGRVLGEEALGLYTIAFRLPEILLSNVAWTLSVVAFPALARLRRDEGDDLSAATGRMVGLLALYAVPVGVAISLLAEPIVATLFPARWTAAAPVLVAVALTTAMTTIVFPLGDAGKARGRQGTLLLLNVFHVPLMIAAMAVAAPYGIEAVAWAGTGATVVFVGLFLVWASRSVGLRLRPMVREVRPAAAATAGLAVALSVLRLLWPWEEDVVLLLAGGPLALAGALLGLRLLAPGVLTELHDEFGGLLRRRGGGPADADPDAVTQGPPEAHDPQPTPPGPAPGPGA